jgi:Flp pilus assembly protein TadD
MQRRKPEPSSQTPQNLGRRNRPRGFSIVRAAIGAWGMVSGGRANRLIGRAVVCAALLAGVGYVTGQALARWSSRTLNLCVVSDFYYRDQKPNWQAGLEPLFREVNDKFRSSGVRWKFHYAGDAYPIDADGGMAERKDLLADVGACRNADVVLGLTGRGERRGNSNVTPFAHSLLVAVTAADPDALAAKVVARALANLFGVPVDTQTLITTTAAPGELFDPASIELISRLRNYEFAKGVRALSDSWEPRVMQALSETVTARNANPAVEARRILGRAFAAGLQYDDAIREFREAAKTSPQEFAVRFEYAMGLIAGSESEQAIAELRACTKLEPEDARPHAAMGAIYLNSLRVDEAVEEFRLATRLEPRNAAYLSVLGKALLKQPGRMREANAAFQAAAQLHPNEEGAYSGMTFVAGLEEELGNASRTLEAAARQQPGSSGAHLRAGVARAYAGDLDAAEKEVRRSIELDPRNGVAYLAMARIHYLRGDYATADADLLSARTNGATPSLTLINSIKRKLGQATQ